MNRVLNFFLGGALIFALLMPYTSFSQENDISSCNSFPTADNALNDYIRSMVTANNNFDSRMKGIYETITPSDQQIVTSYIRTNNTSLFDAYPQFNDSELTNNLSAFRESYSLIWVRHSELYPGLDSLKRSEEIKKITECASVKIKAQEFESLRVAGDLCETQRINCILSVAAQATGMHLACASLDLTIIAGIICHGAAFTYQWTEGNNCNVTARLCKEGRVLSTQH